MYRNLLLDKNNKETLMFGNSGFPIFLEENNLKEFALGYVPWHWHDEIQLSVVTEGSVMFQLQRGQHILSAGEGIFINSGFLHMSKPNDADGTYVCVDVNPKLISSFPGSVIEEKYFRPFLGSERMSAMPLYPDAAWSADVLENIMDVYNLYLDKDFGHELKITAKLIGIWESLIKSDMQNTTAPAYLNPGQRAMKDIITYIESHYSEKISLDDIANHVHLSKGECCRSFKRNANTTIFEYLIAYRVQKSSELLINSTMTISQIASAVGFASSSYFTEAFKKYTGQTPSEHRLSIQTSAI